jgi:hypothetical protein
LNPCLEKLLTYEDLENRVIKVEETFIEFLNSRKIKSQTISLSLGLWSWAHHVFQLLSIEFIRELAQKIKEIDPNIILEVGAGEALLGKYLMKELNKEIILTDDYSWWEKDNLVIKNKDVIKLNYKDAINRYKPDLILASWIPYRQCWTKDFIKHECVKGYILIGEGPGGCTGSDIDWESTWILHNLENVERFGICRSDNYFFGNKTRHTNVSYFEIPK